MLLHDCELSDLVEQSFSLNAQLPSHLLLDFHDFLSMLLTQLSCHLLLLVNSSFQDSHLIYTKCYINDYLLDSVDYIVV